MSMSNWKSVRICALTVAITLNFLGLSVIFGQCQMNCISSIEISLDQAGYALVLPDMVLIDTNNCFSQKTILVTDQNGESIPDGSLNCTHIGQTLTVKIMDTDSQASCWSSLFVIDNSPPQIFDCIDHEVFCNTPMDSITMPTFDDNCSTVFTTSFTDEIIEQLCDTTFVKIVNRTYFVTDTYGNQSVACTQQISFKPIKPGDIILPENLIIENCVDPDTSPDATGFPNVNELTIDIISCQYDVTFNDITIPLCGNSYKIFRTFSIYNWCTNNHINHIQKIEVIDTEPPDIECNGDTLTYVVNDQCLGDVSLIDLNITDNCNNFIVEYDWQFALDNTQVPLGLFPITAIATDDCNNQSTCDFFIEVADSIPPIAICESDLVVNLDENGNFILNADFLNGASTDNCEVSELLVSIGTGFVQNFVFNCDQVGAPINITLMVIDASGNFSLCSSEITVLDNILPTITCPDDITIRCFDDPLDLSITGNATSTDNCEEYEPTFGDSLELTVCNSGSIFRTFSVTENGTTISCDQKISLIVDNPSVIFPEDITIECGQVEDLDIVGQPIVTAMCPGFAVDKNDEKDVALNCDIITTRTWKVFDNCLDTIIQSIQRITEIDTLPPVLIQPAISIIINCQIGDIDSLDNWLMTNGGAIAEDLCSEVIWTNNFDSFDFICSNTGSTAVTFTAADNCGNSVSTDANFIIIDTIPPIFTIMPANILLPCETNAQQEIDNYILTNGGAIITDQCSNVTIVSELLDEFDNSCDTLRVRTTGTDLCGFSISAISTIIVIDETAPEIQTPPMGIEIACESGSIQNQIDDWLITNGGAIATDLCGVITWTNNFNAAISVCGTPIPVTFTVSDECGNNTSAIASYTVIDNFPPIISEPAIDVTFECDGFENLIDINDYLNNNGFSSAMDLCSSIIWSNDFVKIDSICGGTGTSLVNFTATDVCGNEASTSGLITIIDTTPPDVLIPIQEFVVECDGFGNILEFNQWVQANANIAVEDICSEVEFTFDFNSLINTCANAGSVFTVFIAADECNNRTNLATNFIIIDTTPPIINCPNDLVVTDTDMNCSEFIILPPTTAIDICNGSLFFSFEIDYNSDGTIDLMDNGNNASGDYPVGIHTVNYIVEDECGNIGVCQQLIEVVDGSGIAFDCVDTFLLGVDATNTATLDPESIAMISMCFDGTPILSQNTFTCDDCGDNEITLTVIDPLGNPTTCTTTIFICDLANNCTDCVPCSGLAVGGLISTENDIPIAEVEVNVAGTNTDVLSNETGNYFFEGVSNSSYSIAPYKNDDPTNGVTTLDLIAIQRHILGLAPLESPYQKIAADANNSGSITTLDVVDIQRVILQVSDGFTNNTSWRFVDRSYNFPDPNNPFTSTFPEVIAINELINQQLDNDFVAVKIGDVNQTFIAGKSNLAYRNNDHILINVKDELVEQNETVEVILEFTEDRIPINGYQFTLGFDPTLFEFVSINQLGLKEMNLDNFGLKNVQEGIILANWAPSDAIADLDHDAFLFSFKLSAKQNTNLYTNIWIQEEPLINEVYLNGVDEHVDIHQFKLEFTDQISETTRTINEKVRLFQNEPNPFTGTTQIKFYMPQETKISLDIHEATGKLVWSQQEISSAGINAITIHGKDLGNDGIYICTLRSVYGSETIKLVHISN